MIEDAASPFPADADVTGHLGGADAWVVGETLTVSEGGGKGGARFTRVAEL